jgi:hypothetical protein
MPRTCTVCRHQEVDAINHALVESVSFKPIADRFGLTKQALMRHKSKHIPQMLENAKEATEAVQATDLLGSIRALHIRTLAILKKAEAAGELMIALKAIQQARGNLELLAKLDGQLKDREPGNLSITVNYVDRAIIAPAATSPRCIESSVVSANSEK